MNTERDKSICNCGATVGRRHARDCPEPNRISQLLNPPSHTTVPAATADAPAKVRDVEIVCQSLFEHGYAWDTRLETAVESALKLVAAERLSEVVASVEWPITGGAMLGWTQHGMQLLRSGELQNGTLLYTHPQTQPSAAGDASDDRQINDSDPVSLAKRLWKASLTCINDDTSEARTVARERNNERYWAIRCAAEYLDGVVARMADSATIVGAPPASLPDKSVVTDANHLLLALREFKTRDWHSTFDDVLADQCIAYIEASESARTAPAASDEVK